MTTTPSTIVIAGDEMLGTDAENQRDGRRRLIFAIVFALIFAAGVASLAFGQPALAGTIAAVAVLGTAIHLGMPDVADPAEERRMRRLDARLKELGIERLVNRDSLSPLYLKSDEQPLSLVVDVVVKRTITITSHEDDSATIVVSDAPESSTDA